MSVQMHAEYLLSLLMYANMIGKMMQRTMLGFDTQESSSIKNEEEKKEIE